MPLQAGERYLLLGPQGNARSAARPYTDPGVLYTNPGMGR